jgi:NAD(P)-dependent dehydrogenase (short-subunit alcohol dehydrogenase family)
MKRIDRGAQCGQLNCDVTDKAQVTSMVEQAVATYGRLDAAFTNAGINSDTAPL